MDAWKPLGEFDDLPEVPDAAPEVTSATVVVEEIPAIPQPAWERTAELGLFKLWWKPFAKSSRRPSRHSAPPPRPRANKRPLVFFTLMTTLAVWVSFLYRVAIAQVSSEALAPAIPKGMTQSEFL